MRTIAIVPPDAGKWYIDLKNGSGAVGSGDPSSGAADVTFTLKDADFVDMFSGKLKPTSAFMSGKLKLSGDMGKAMALEKMMKKMHARSFHTSTSRFSDDGGVAKVFKDVENVLSEDLVKKVNAVYAFKVQGKRIKISNEKSSGKLDGRGCTNVFYVLPGCS